MPDPETTSRTTGQLNAALAGRYVFETEIGRGGMATVYRARDVRHNRNVAIKVLRDDIGAALGPERFLSEIEVTANLQHPNLLPLFDSGAADGILFYVMPFVEGQTLRQRLEREGQLPVDEAVRIASSIAGALDYAHRHGVVHRDLKPENILLHERQPLVMDFGIAFAVSNAGGERLTQMGISLGTPQYMSPEQATGDRALDARSDIYSLGVVLYEMLAGSPPHSGNSVQAVIAKVIMDRPTSVRATRQLVPEHVDAAIGCALAKLPADRYSSASDFARALTGEHALALRELPAGGAPLPVVRSGAAGAIGRVLARPVARRVVVGSAWTVVLGTAAAAGATAALAWYAMPERPYAKFPVSIPDSVVIPTDGRSVAISANGSQLAVVGGVTGQRSRLYTRPMAGVTFGALHGTESAQSPTFSPDGTSLLYAANGRLMKVSSAGGAALPLADSTDGQHSWGEGDVVVFTRRGAVWSVSARGGSARLVARADSARGARALRSPEVLPGGTHALITIERAAGQAPDSNHVGVVSLSDGEVTDLGIVGTGARFAPPGHVIYATADGSLWAVPFSPRKRSFTGAKVLLASGVQVSVDGAVDVAVSATGTVVYGERPNPAAAGSRRASVAVVDRTGAAKKTSAQVGLFLAPRVSPDGARIALTVRESGGRTDVWIYEIATGQLTPMTRDGASVTPEWLDARRILFRHNPDRRAGRFMLQPWDHSAEAQLFLSPAGTAGTSSVHSISAGPSSGYLAVIRSPGGPVSRAKRQDIHIAPMARAAEQKEFVVTDASELTPRISPNGRWLAYTSNESGTFQVYVLPVPGPGPRVPVSIDHGIEPVWSRDGRSLYYVSHTSLLAAHVDESSGFRATRQDTLFDFSARGFAMYPPNTRGPSLGFYDVFANGDVAVLTRATGGSGRTSVVALLNWQRLLEAGGGEGTPK